MSRIKHTETPIMTNDSPPEGDSPHEIEATYKELSEVIDNKILNTVSQRFAQLSSPLRIQLLYTINRSKISFDEILDQHDVSKDEIETHLNELTRQNVIEEFTDDDEKIYTSTIEGSKLGDAIIDQLELELSAEHELTRFGDSSEKLREANIGTKPGDKKNENFD